MSAQFLLTVQAAIVILGPIALGWWLRRRLDVSWRTWGWGAVTFVGAQIARLPVLVVLSLLLSQTITAPPDSTFVFSLNLVILAGTSGLFEETARWLVLSRIATAARGWRSSVMFGAGHGGIEAILLVGGANLFSLAVLGMGEAMLAQMQGGTTSQAAIALATHREALLQLHWWESGLAIWERVWAMTFHIAAAVMVMQAVMTGRWFWWGVAVLAHALLNAAALIAARASGAVAAEIIVTLFGLFALYIIVRFHWIEQRRAARQVAEAQERHLAPD